MRPFDSGATVTVVKEVVMNKVIEKTFENTEVPLHKSHYDRCKFQSCTFVFDGSTQINMSNNAISSDCVFKFTGAAENTVRSMQGIFSMGPWGQDIIVSTFKKIAPQIKNISCERH